MTWQVEEILGKDRTVVFHLPTSLRKPSFLLSFALQIDEEKPKDNYVIGCFSRQLSTPGSSSFLGMVSSLVDRNCDPVMGWSIRLAYGAMLYAHCFPDAVTDALPNDVKHPAHHQYETVQTLDAHPRICLGGTHVSPHAHYRRGHFKVLRHERWGKSKGKTVFVTDTFVRGHAQTILPPEEVTK